MKIFLRQCFAIGLPRIFPGSPPWQGAGVILFSFTAMDRMMGYGLKYKKGYIFTHLRTIGPKREPNA